jgi:hypothetical protein
MNTTKKKSSLDLNNFCNKAFDDSMLNEVKRYGTAPGSFSSVSWNRVIAILIEATSNTR